LGRTFSSRIKVVAAVHVEFIRHLKNGLGVFLQFPIFRRGRRRQFQIHDVRVPGIEFDRFLQTSTTIRSWANIPMSWSRMKMDCFNAKAQSREAATKHSFTALAPFPTGIFAMDDLVVAVPEPGTCALFSLAAAMGLGLRRSRLKS